MSDSNGNSITDLREHLFDALKLLKAGKLEVGAAKAIAQIGGVVIETAKVELKAMEQTGRRTGTGFLEQAGEPPKLEKAPEGTPGTLPGTFFTASKAAAPDDSGDDDVKP